MGAAMRSCVTYEREVLRFPDVVVINSHEDDPYREVELSMPIRFATNG
jgi:hypothetical protein